MPIQHAKVTVVRNLEEEGYMNYVSRTWFGNEGEFTAKDTIVVWFEEDESMYDTKEKEKREIVFSPMFSDLCPNWFTVGNHTAFYEPPQIVGNKLKLSFDLLDEYKTKHGIQLEASCYNMMYTLCTNEPIFGLAKIKSNENSPRFSVFYDGTRLDKHDVLHLVERMLILV